MFVGFAGGSVKFIGGGQFFVGPALYALFMAALDVIYIFLAFPETLPSNKRVHRQLALTYSHSLLWVPSAGIVDSHSLLWVPSVGIVDSLCIWLFDRLQYFVVF